MQTRAMTALLCMGLTLTAAGCRRNKVEPIAPVSPIGGNGAASASAAELEAQRLAREKAMRDSLEREAASRAARSAAEMEALRTSLQTPVRFEFDASELTAEARAILDAKLPILRANPGLRIRVSGHTDTRGADEYNLALGLRRAAATRKYLSDRGVPASRMDVVSFGEERPSQSGEDEGSWAQNRRAEFEIVAGGAVLRVPQ
jgi:peptidoglycan-associated lipoprotein